MSTPEDEKQLQIIYDIARKVDLDKNDVDQIKRSNKQQKLKALKWALFSYLMGFLGGWVFLSSKNWTNTPGYPVSQIFIGSSLISNIRTSKARKSLIIVFSFIILLFSGYISGGVFASFQPIDFRMFPIGGTLYGVYSHQGA